MNLNEAIETLAAAERVLVVTDFDGTLAPIVEDPATARPLPAALAALIRLASYPAISVAIVSGRRRSELQDLVGPLPDVILVGEHGSDWGDSDEPAEPQLVDELTKRLNEIAAETPGAIVEPKRWSVVFHYRTVDPRQVETALRTITEGPAKTAGVTVTSGKKVMELHATERTKGDAFAKLRSTIKAAAVLFIGDDVTDETVFAHLGPEDVGVKVGPGETLAQYRVDDPDQVVSVFEYLIDVIDR